MISGYLPHDFSTFEFFISLYGTIQRLVDDAWWYITLPLPTLFDELLNYYGASDDSFFHWLYDELNNLGVFSVLSNISLFSLVFGSGILFFVSVRVFKSLFKF